MLTSDLFSVLDFASVEARRNRFASTGVTAAMCFDDFVLFSTASAAKERSANGVHLRQAVLPQHSALVPEPELEKGEHVACVP